MGTDAPVPSVNLPPLPPIGGQTTGRSVLDVLAEQHRELVELTEKLAAAPADHRLADVVTATLSRHLSAEEQYLYPAVRKVVPGGDELADRELAQDHDLLLLLQHYHPDKSGQIFEAVRRHAAADAEELLPVLTQMVSAEDLIRIGNRIETAEESAPTRPHPGTPSTPPWTKIVEPAVAVADTLRDVVTRRTTYPNDL
jgi:hypothetical protein